MVLLDGANSSTGVTCASGESDSAAQNLPHIIKVYYSYFPEHRSTKL